jgi:CheY-like chemotaxis protein
LRKILIVDDDELFLESILRMFHLVGEDWVVTTAANGCEALMKVASLEFGAVVIDLMMPEKEGLETILALKVLRPELPVIAISGGSRLGGDCLPVAKAFGARYVLRKPFEFEVLLQRLTEIVGQP